MARSTGLRNRKEIKAFIDEVKRNLEVKTEKVISMDINIKNDSCRKDRKLKRSQVLQSTTKVEERLQVRRKQN